MIVDELCIVYKISRHVIFKARLHLISGGANRIYIIPISQYEAIWKLQAAIKTSNTVDLIHSTRATLEVSGVCIEGPDPHMR